MEKVQIKIYQITKYNYLLVHYISYFLPFNFGIIWLINKVIYPITLLT